MNQGPDCSKTARGTIAHGPLNDLDGGPLTAVVTGFDSVLLVSGHEPRPPLLSFCVLLPPNLHWRQAGYTRLTRESRQRTEENRQTTGGFFSPVVRQTGANSEQTYRRLTHP